MKLVKNLVWTDCMAGGPMYHANGAGLWYEIYSDRNGKYRIWLPSEAEARRHISLDLAKRLAQQCHARRVLEMLTEEAREILAMGAD